MSSKSKECACVQNVGCTVRDCKYHTAQNFCNASRITVENETAQRKGETFCSTFESKASL